MEAPSSGQSTGPGQQSQPAPKSVPAGVLADLVTHGREERNLEYKASFAWGKGGEPLRSRVIKTCLALANLRDGGAVVVGVVEDPQGTFTPVGVEGHHLKTYLQDPIQENINQHADPFIDVTVATVQLEGKAFVVLQVRPFDQVPVICKKNGIENLRGGAIYTRARKKHETIEVPSQTEMREILDRATENGVQRWVEIGLHSGAIKIGGPVADAAEQFNEQLGAL